MQPVTFIFKDEAFKFETLHADIGEVIVTTAQIPEGDEDAWTAAWRATAERTAKRGRGLTAGRRHRQRAGSLLPRVELLPVGRYAAYDHRSAAVVCNDGMTTFFASYPPIPRHILSLIEEKRDEEAIPLLEDLKENDTNGRCGLQNGTWVNGVATSAEYVRHRRVHADPRGHRKASQTGAGARG